LSLLAVNSGVHLPRRDINTTHGSDIYTSFWLSVCEEFREAFEIFDDNKDGQISREELTKMMTRLGQMTSEEEITSIMTKADKDRM